MEKIKINEKKSIGDVVFILEGKKTEFKLFSNLFEKIFSITEIVKCKSVNSDLKKYKLPKNSNSIVYLLNSRSSSIKSVDDNEYIDQLFRKINSYFKIDILNSAIYFIWDRDKDSNKMENVVELLKKFYNSRDNGYEMQGLLLLSYPSIESFIISCFENNILDDKIQNIKKYVNMNKYKINQIDKEKLENAVKIFLTRYNEMILNRFSLNDIDEKMKEINLKIFEYEENYHNVNKHYYHFSCLLVAMIDLGLIEII